MIRVSDDGVGMTADTVPRLFDLFAQADRTLDRSKGGLGLGLTLVRQLVALHRGSVEARSSGLGEGSEFLVRLPLLEGRPIEGEARLPSPPADVALARRVLLVDDNEDAAQSLAMILTHHGHEVWVENDGSKAVAMADRVRPQAVILDIGLPGVDGYHIARSLRGRAHTAKVLSIALTGYGKPEDVERAFAAGFDYNFIKPVQPCVLHSLLLDKVLPSQDEAR